MFDFLKKKSNDSSDVFNVEKYLELVKHVLEKINKIKRTELDIDKIYLIFEKIIQEKQLSKEDKSEYESFLKLINTLRGTEKISNKVEENIVKVISEANIVLDIYKDFKEKEIKINGEKKTISYSEKPFKIDSSNWEEENLIGIKVLIDPTGQITEFLEGDFKGIQLFSNTDLLEKYLKKYGLRLPNKNELNELIKIVGAENFTNKYPGFRVASNLNFMKSGKIARYWVSDSTDIDDKKSVEIEELTKKVSTLSANANLGLLICPIKDNNN